MSSNQNRRTFEFVRLPPNPALERTRGSVRGSAMKVGARAAQGER